ncbi:hypothetical protein ACFS6H_04045 [Terrimonas rubra]|uniref:Uncharacterized protein n=1 Tax=Terrimonas rubra TaxID=1035890 RepID=A0ABW6A0Q0_9BACT
MSKKAKKTEWEPKGNNIQIRYERYLKDGYVLSHTLILRVAALGFQSKNDDEWIGTWEGNQIWVKFTKPGWEIVFSDNFPAEHKGAAEAEVRRIERQFN